MSVGPSAVRGFDADRPVGGRECDQHEPGADQRAQAPGDQLEQARQLDLAGERGPDLVQCLELLRPGCRRLVEPGVLDRDRRLRRQQLRELLVLVREVVPTGLLGQVEVPVGDAAEHDRQPEERLHRRMVGREADGAGVVGDLVEPQRLGVADQHAQEAAPAREVADRVVRRRVHPGRQESLQRVPGLVDHAERGVARAGDRGGGLDDLLQERVERELGAERDTCVDEDAEPVGLVQRRAHGRILLEACRRGARS